MAIKRKTFGGEGVAAVNRALTVVIALEAAGEAISLAELSRQTGLYKSTLLRLIASLEQFALVAVRPDKKYCLGPLAFRLGRAFEATDHLQDQVVPALESLVEQGTESASFHVRHDHKQRLCLFRENRFIRPVPYRPISWPMIIFSMIFLRAGPMMLIGKKHRRPNPEKPSGPFFPDDFFMADRLF